MKIKNQRSLISLCYLTLFFCALCLYVAVADIIAGLNGFEFSTDPKFAHYFIFYGKHFFSIALVGVLSAIIVNTLKGIKTNNAFPKNNVPVIIAAGILAPFVGSYSETLKNVFAGEYVNTLDGTGIFAMLLLFLFAILYKFASLASEDSNLAI